MHPNFIRTNQAIANPKSHLRQASSTRLNTIPVQPQIKFMDPITIATTAAAVSKTAYELAKFISTGVKAVSSVDRTVQIFEKEVSTLGKTLILIDSAFQDPQLGEIHQESREENGFASRVLDGISEQLTDCENTLIKLDVIIENASKGKKNIFRRTITAIKLDFNSSEIALVRQEIRNSTDALKLTLPLLNMYDTNRNYAKLMVKGQFNYFKVASLQ